MSSTLHGKFLLAIFHASNFPFVLAVFDRTGSSTSGAGGTRNANWVRWARSSSRIYAQIRGTHNDDGHSSECSGLPCSPAREPHRGAAQLQTGRPLGNGPHHWVVLHTHGDAAARSAWRVMPNSWPTQK